MCVVRWGGLRADSCFFVYFLPLTGLESQLWYSKGQSQGNWTQGGRIDVQDGFNWIISVFLKAYRGLLAETGFRVHCRGSSLERWACVMLGMWMVWLGELLGHIPVIHNTVSKIVRDRVKAGFLLKPNSFSLISSTQRNGIIRIEKALCFSVAQRTSLKGALHEFFLLQMVEKKK